MESNITSAHKHGLAKLGLFTACGLSALSLAVLAGCGPTPTASASAGGSVGGISPKAFADGVHAVMMADRRGAGMNTGRNRHWRRRLRFPYRRRCRRRSR